MAFNPQDYPEKPGARRAFLPPGKHRVTAFVLETGDTVVVEFRRQSDAMSRKSWFPTEGGAAFKLANLLRAVGWTHSVDTYDIEAMRRVLEGVPLEIVVADEVYQGKTETKVKWTNRLPGTPDRAAPDGEGRPPGDEEVPF